MESHYQGEKTKAVAAEAKCTAATEDYDSKATWGWGDGVSPPKTTNKKSFPKDPCIFKPMHLVEFYGKCKGTITIYMDPTGILNETIYVEKSSGEVLFDSQVHLE